MRTHNPEGNCQAVSRPLPRPPAFKSLWRPQHAPAYLACFDRFAATYLEAVGWEPRAKIESRVAYLLPALFLARIDGKSPIEYVTAARDKERVRAIARPLIANPCGELGAIRRAWAREVLG